MKEEIPSETPARSAPRTIRFLIGMALGCLVVVSFMLWTQDRDEATLGSPGHPVIFMLSPEHGRNLTSEDRTALVDLLEKGSGLRIEILVAATPLAAIESFGAHADVGLLNLFEYILARREYGVSAALQATRDDGRSHYAGAIAVRAADDFQSPADLAGKTVAYVDPFSTSGFVFPARLFRDGGYDVKPLFCGSHEGVLDGLIEGKAEAAATYAAAVENDSRFRIIARTEHIPHEPLFFRNSVRDEKRARLIAAFTGLAGSSEGARLLALLADIRGFRATTDEDYAPVMTAVRRAGVSVYSLVPEGIHVESRRRGIEILY